MGLWVYVSFCVDYVLRFNGVWFVIVSRIETDFGAELKRWYVFEKEDCGVFILI